MKWASGLSEHPSLDRALGDCLASVQQQLEGQTPDLVLVFASAEHIKNIQDLGEKIQKKPMPKSWLGAVLAGS